MALKRDKELYVELLQPLQVAASERHIDDPSYYVDLDDDDDILPQPGAVNLSD